MGHERKGKYAQERERASVTQKNEKCVSEGAGV